jgi:hypothetical protein
VYLLTDLFGLPAHALLVHAAVVLVPLAALGVALIGWRASWRRSYLLPLALLAVTAAGFAFLAKESGEPLQASVRSAARAAGARRPSFGEHPQQGDAAMIWAALLAFGAVGLLAVDWWSRRIMIPARLPALPRWAPGAAYVVVLIPAVIAVFAMIAAGHSGAQLVWRDVGTYTSGG